VRKTLSLERVSEKRENLAGAVSTERIQRVHLRDVTVSNQRIQREWQVLTESSERI
jgi:hypothetical protein